MENCLVCGHSNEASKFGKYCSVECRDSDLAVLGKTFICNSCGNEFKSLKKESLCINCMKSPVESIEPDIMQPKISKFKYSIFEDNVQRIVDASKCGDKRNCRHAVKVISENIDYTMLPELNEMMVNSNKNAQFWFIEIVAKLNDKRAIKHLKKYLNKLDEDVQAKALETIDLLQNCG